MRKKIVSFSPDSLYADMEFKPRMYYLASVCHVCKSKDTKYTCHICRLVFYCSSEHRRQDWFEHSKLCWAVNKVCEVNGINHLYALFNGDDFTSTRHKMARKCMELLGRGLHSWELQVLYHSRVRRVKRPIASVLQVTL